MPETRGEIALERTEEPLRGGHISGSSIEERDVFAPQGRLGLGSRLPQRNRLAVVSAGDLQLRLDALSLVVIEVCTRQQTLERRESVRGEGDDLGSDDVRNGHVRVAHLVQTRPFERFRVTAQSQAGSK